VTTPRLDKASQSSKWATALEKAGTFLQTAPPAMDKLPDWIGERLSRHGLKADRDTLVWLATRVEGNLLAAHQEIEKLALLLPPGTLDMATARSAVVDVARYDVGDLSEAFLKADAARFCRILDGLKAEGEGLPLVLAVVGNEIRTLYRLAAGLSRGQRLANLMQELRGLGQPPKPGGTRPQAGRTGTPGPGHGRPVPARPGGQGPAQGRRLGRIEAVGTGADGQGQGPGVRSDMTGGKGETRKGKCET
jgi:DNA polymerase III delta subunit